MMWFEMLEPGSSAHAYDCLTPQSPSIRNVEMDGMIEFEVVLVVGRLVVQRDFESEIRDGHPRH